ncbi:exodeoxyribonuclease III [Pelistega sp. MC2]|uniref:exodeoxyribonuclease III n=1 Tax=Pelistega sp. MC2 TaxID=1720297 RepID=UPI0008DA440D|nr:exodeoxyribonuclease III [Pelistega sp. MC2]
MKIASWNVNSLSVRIEQVIGWLKNTSVDVLCLQELKMESSKFPAQLFHELGYQAIWSGQKTYNGVAIISKTPLTVEQYNNPYYADAQQRLIAANIQINDQTIRLICVYCPNGSELGSDKFTYKMQWFDALNVYLKEQLNTYPNLVLTGDFNIAPDDRDVHAKYQSDILVSPEERQQFSNLLALGLHDSFRLFEQEEKSFSWWDYRQFAFKRNAGLRIDHLLISNALTKKCTASSIDKAPRGNERPSDHTPVIVTLDMTA